MYKIFIKDKSFELTNSFGKDSLESGTLFFQHHAKEEIATLLEMISEFDPVKRIVLKSNNLEGLWLQFKHYFKVVAAAGGIVENSRGEVLVIKRNGRWDLPKGKLEKNESAETGALREVEEECGIKGLEVKSLVGQTHHVYEEKGKQVLKTTSWFSMQAPDDQNFVPQTNEGITEVKWLRRADFEDFRSETYPSLAYLIGRFG